MAVPARFSHTAVTAITMVECFTFSIYTVATFVTMENLFRFVLVIEHSAFATKILCKFNFTFFTLLLRLLNAQTKGTLYICHLKSVHFMIFNGVLLKIIMNLIMAFSTGVEFFALRALQLALSHIMGASQFWTFAFFKACSNHSALLGLKLLHKYMYTSNTYLFIQCLPKAFFSIWYAFLPNKNKAWPIL